MNTTIVTMFYDIRKKEMNHDTTNRSSEKYIELSKQFILKLPYNIIFFTDDDHIIKIINEERKFLLDKTHIVKQQFENTYYYQHIDTIKSMQNKYIIQNAKLSHETPMYIALNNNKFHFMEYSIKENPFKSSHFIWMDFGINHVALSVDYINKWINNIPNKIRQLCINPYIEPNVVHKEVFKTIYHHTAGGLFSGSIYNLLIYCKLFKEQVEKMYQESWYQIDEAVMTIVQRENPDLFDLYYGDYASIISNYMFPVHDLYLIVHSLNKCIQFNDHTTLQHLIQYSLPFIYRCDDEHYLYQFLNAICLLNTNISTEIKQIFNKYKHNKNIANLIHKYNITF